MSATVRCSVLLAFAFLFGCAPRSGTRAVRPLPVSTPIERAIAYLSREVPSWPEKNGCHSCHNNGDGARALYVALGKSYEVSPSFLAETGSWLSAPRDWEKNKGDPRSSDRHLATVQFAVAAAAGRRSGAIPHPEALSRAAELLVALQSADGAWHTTPEDDPGGPTAYGTRLATYQALRTLQQVQEERFGEAIRHARAWLADKPVRNVFDAAVFLLAASAGTDSGDSASRSHAFEIIERGQAPDGGWGPFSLARPETFDTALVLLALHANRDRLGASFAGAIEKGRTFLLKHQLEDGGWEETTRPSGAESYAQHISTTAWALMALLETE